MSATRRTRTSSRSVRPGEGDGELRPINKKRKLSEKLGPQWTDENISAFFDAFKVHGREWDKVAELLEGRDAGMCETLYTMNKAYLSLPDGVINALGLSAMMTDHYNNLEESEGAPASPGSQDTDTDTAAARPMDVDEPGSVGARPPPATAPAPPSASRQPSRSAARPPAGGSSAGPKPPPSGGGGPTGAKVAKGSRTQGRRTPRAPRTNNASMAAAAAVLASGGRAGPATSGNSDGMPSSSSRGRAPASADDIAGGDSKGKRKRSRQLFVDEDGGVSALLALAKASDDVLNEVEQDQEKTKGGSPRPRGRLRSRKSAPENVPAMPSPLGKVLSPRMLNTLRQSANNPGMSRLGPGGGGGGGGDAGAGPSGEAGGAPPAGTPGGLPLKLRGKKGRAWPTDDQRANWSRGEARVQHALSSRVRRWCTYEWFVSSIDLPYFSRNELHEYLSHLGLGGISSLTRVEWGEIRASLGTPRRLSRRFLLEERLKLERWREEVRSRYQDLKKRGGRVELPPELPRPLTVGQRVHAKHPKTRLVHGGSLLTVDRVRCRVQFDRPELGSELVADIDIMPQDMHENLAEAHKRALALQGLAAARVPGFAPPPRGFPIPVSGDAAGGGGAPGLTPQQVAAAVASVQADAQGQLRLHHLSERREVLRHAMHALAEESHRRAAAAAAAEAAAAAGGGEEGAAAAAAEAAPGGGVGGLGEAGADEIQEKMAAMGTELAVVERALAAGVEAARMAAVAAGGGMAGGGAWGGASPGPAGAGGGQPEVGVPPHLEALWHAKHEAGGLLRSARARVEDASASAGAAEAAAPAPATAAAEEGAPPGGGGAEEGGAEGGGSAKGKEPAGGGRAEEGGAEGGVSTKGKEPAGGGRAEAESKMLSDYMQSCVGMLLLVRGLAGGASGVGAAQPAQAAAALDLAVGQLRPRAEGNADVFKEILQHTAQLRELLT